MAQARSRLAQELSKHGKVKRAESLFRQSLGLNPDHVQGWFGLGRTLEALGEADGALGCYLNVLCRRPGHPMALGHYLGLAKGEIESDKLERARAALGDDIVKDEAKALIGYGLAKYHDRRGDYGDAAQVAKPLPEFHAEIAPSVSSVDFYRVDGDVTGPLFESEAVCGRLVLAYEDAGSFVGHSRVQ